MAAGGVSAGGSDGRAAGAGRAGGVHRARDHGSAMSAHLLGASHRIIGYDVSPAACDQHLAQGVVDDTSSVHAVLRALAPVSPPP